MSSQSTLENATNRPSSVIFAGMVLLFLVLIGRVVETYEARGLFDFIGEDYAIYASTARVVRAQGWGRFYDLEAIGRETQSFTAHYGALAGPLRPGPSPYPVVFLVPFLILDHLGDVGGFLGWTALSLGLLAIMARGFGSSRWGVAGYLAPVVYFPAAYNLIVGQLAIVMAFGLYRAIKDLRSGRELAAGMWLGMLLIKPQFALVPLMVLLGLGRLRILAGFMVVSVAMAGSTLFLVGSRGVSQCLAILRSFSGFRETPAVVDPWDMINIRGILLGLPERLVGEGVGALLTGSLSLAVLSSLFWIWRTGWDVEDPRFERKLFATMLVAMLTAYHNHVHGASMLIPVALASLERDPERDRFTALATAGVLIPTAVVAATGVVKLGAWSLVALMAWSLAANRSLGSHARNPAPAINPTHAESRRNQREDNTQN